MAIFMTKVVRTGGDPDNKEPCKNCRGHLVCETLPRGCRGSFWPILRGFGGVQGKECLGRMDKELNANFDRALKSAIVNS